MNSSGLSLERAELATCDNFRDIIVMPKSCYLSLICRVVVIFYIVALSLSQRNLSLFSDGVYILREEVSISARQYVNILINLDKKFK